MASTKHSPLLSIIIRYNKPLERYARRLTQHKHRAPDMVKWAMEALYDEGLFYEGPHLRARLVEHTKTMALGFNRAVKIYNHLQSTGAATAPANNPSSKPSTSH